MISLDTETTGIDLRHGAKPFLVTVCDEQNQVMFWEWDVDPLTRQPQAPADDLRSIRFLAENRLSDRVVTQNGKFDAAALETILPGLEWPWEESEDTLIAGHLLHSAQPHDLTSMVLLYLGKDIKPFEDRLEKACKDARALVRKLRRTEPEFLRWRIASEDLPDMPSAGGSGKKQAAKGAESDSPWKFDAWLPRALAKRLELPADHPWWTVTSEYANADSSSTLALFQVMIEQIRSRGLEAIYRHMMRVHAAAHDLESNGVTYSPERLGILKTEFSDERDKLRAECLEIARGLGFDLELPKGASPNGSLRRFFFDVLKVPPVFNGKARSSEPTLNKDAMALYEQTLDGEAGRFVKALTAGRKFDTQLAFMENYQRHSLPRGDVRVLHQSANPTGTDHLRWSFSNPNMANVSKQEIEDALKRKRKTLRWIFGPGDEREWWKFDCENIELRIPAYTAPEPAMIELFERPDEPPYFGSYHLLNASIIYPDLFWPLAEQKGAFKREYEPTWYQWCKNAGFALIYGCQEETFDRAARKHGAYALLKQRLPNLFKLSAKLIAFADKHGFVETLPDRTVDPRRGYPIECSRSEWGRVSPTIPMNYRTSGTAMQCINKAMVRCGEALREWSRAEGRRYFTTLQVHDELVFDFPAGGVKNLPKVRALKMLMEQSGDDVGVPLKVSVSWHPRNWGESVDPKKEKAVA